MIRSLAWLVVALAVAVPVRSGSAQERPAIVVTDPTAKTYRVAVQRFADFGAGERAQTDRLRRVVTDALEYSGLFVAIGRAAFLGPDQTTHLEDRPVCVDWSQIRADALLEGEIRVDPGNGRVAVEYRVSDVARGCKSLRRHRYRGQREDLELIARRIADDVVGAFTGADGVAGTEIAFVSNRSGIEEIHLMDAMGDGLRAVTHNGSINQFPAWSPDGETLVYTSYREGRRPHLFLLSRNGPSPGRILRGLDPRISQFRGVFAPGGKHLAVVMSEGGSTDLHRITANGRDSRPLTRHRGIDISPTWSPDGKWLAFVSDRAGGPQIYVMRSNGRDLRRLTFDGTYNTAPAWSPDGRWIAYETRIEGQFDIWLIDPEGEINVPLVTHPRSDESPSWAPDGRKIAFSSRRRGRADIYQIDVDGTNLRRITRGGGDDTAPAWGPYPR